MNVCVPGPIFLLLFIPSLKVACSLSMDFLTINHGKHLPGPASLKLPLVFQLAVLPHVFLLSPLKMLPLEGLPL